MNKNYFRKYQILKKRVKDVIFVSSSAQLSPNPSNSPANPPGKCGTLRSSLADPRKSLESDG